MPDAPESCRKAPSQPHNCSRFIVYSKPRKKVQALIDFFAEMFTGRVQMSVLADVPAKRRRVSFAPPGLALIFFANTHSLRCGLHSFAPSELLRSRLPI